ncbi:MAG: TolC family protein [Bacteroidales bacterium]|nr:TolC family protein [Bacteroidales bacterium]
MLYTFRKGLLCGLAIHFFVFLTTVFAPAQERRSLRLEELWHMADSNSKAIAARMAAVEAAQQEVEAARRNMLPGIQLSASVGYLGNGNGWGRDSSYHFTVEMPHFSSSFGVAASQVVYAGGALRRAVALAQMGKSLAEHQLRQTQQDVRFRLTGYFLDLYRLARQVQVYDSNIALTQKLIENICSRQEQGAALRNDITRYELQLSALQLQRLSLSNDMLIINRRITTLIGIGPEVTIDPEMSMDIVSSNSIMTEDQYRQMAYQRSPGLLLAQTGLDMSRSQEALLKAEGLPYVAVVAQDNLNGPVTIDIQPYDVNYNFWYAGVAIRYDLSSLYKNGRKVDAARWRTRQKSLDLSAAQDEIDNAIHEAYVRLGEAATSLLSKEKNLELANMNYSVIENRYRNELALLTDMIDASNTKLAAELDLVSARIVWVYSHYKLFYLAGSVGWE